MEKPTTDRAYFGWTTHRVQQLTDGVFAIAMTLLVLSITIEKPAAGLIKDMLPGKLMDLWPDLLHYFQSFIILASFWMKHHQQYHLIKHTDRPMTWLNILALAFICLIPFSTTLVGDYGDQLVAVIVFEANMLIAGLIFYWQWAYATRKHHLIDKNLDVRVIRAYKFDNLVIPTISVIAIIISLYSPRTGTLPFIITPFFFLFSRKWER